MAIASPSLASPADFGSKEARFCCKSPLSVSECVGDAFAVGISEGIGLGEATLGFVAPLPLAGTSVALPLPLTTAAYVIVPPIFWCGTMFWVCLGGCASSMRRANSILVPLVPTVDSICVLLLRRVMATARVPIPSDILRAIDAQCHVRACAQRFAAQLHAVRSVSLLECRLRLVRPRESRHVPTPGP